MRGSAEEQPGGADGSLEQAVCQGDDHHDGEDHGGADLSAYLPLIPLR